MALSTSTVQDAITDFSALLPEIGKVIAAKGANIVDDITTVEHFAEALVHGAAALGVPYAATAEKVVPLAHQLMGVLASWSAAKSTT